MRRTTTILMASFVATALLTAMTQTADADHFASRRRDAELRRQQAAQAPALRPWGGPTTGKAFWKPVPKGRHFVVNTRPFVAPGRYVWYRGRLIYVPYRTYSPYYVSSPQHVYIERIIRK